MWAMKHDAFRRSAKRVQNNPYAAYMQSALISSENVAEFHLTLLWL
jgi:hypothetical protein